MDSLRLSWRLFCYVFSSPLFLNHQIKLVHCRYSMIFRMCQSAISFYMLNKHRRRVYIFDMRRRLTSIQSYINPYSQLATRKILDQCTNHEQLLHFYNLPTPPVDQTRPSPSPVGREGGRFRGSTRALLHLRREWVRSGALSSTL